MARNNRNIRAPITQRLVNAYPGWSAIRNDEQSQGSQLLNPIGNALQDVNEQLINLGHNYYLTTANVGDADVVYQFSLPANYTFNQAEGFSEDNPQYLSPLVSGLQDGNWYIVSGVDSDTLEDFWYNVVPKRILLSGFDAGSYILDDLGDNIYGGILEFYEHQSPYLIASGQFIDPPGKLWVEVLSGLDFLSESEDGPIHRCIVTMAGITRQGVEDQESMVFLHNNIQQTIKEWGRLDSVRLQDVSPDGTTVRIFNHRFERGFTPDVPPHLDFYNLWESIESRQELDVFWDVIKDTANKHLVLKTWVAEDVRDRINNLTSIKAVREWELLDTTGTTLEDIKDLALMPFSHYIFVVTEDSLLIYDNHWDIPDMSVLNKKSQSPMSKIVPDNYHITLADQARIEYIWHRPQSEINKHRAWCVAPDGTKYTIEDNTLSPIDLNGSWSFVQPAGRFIRRQSLLTLNQRGDWLFNFDVAYRNGVVETDQHIISVDYKEALAEFSLTDLLPDGSTVLGIDITPDQKVYILAIDDGDVSKYQVTLFYDTMLVDFDKKILYLRDEFEKISIEAD